MNAVPLVPLVVSFGVALSFLAWSGLRSVEDSSAIVDHDRRLLTQGTALRAEIDRQSQNQDDLAGVIIAGGLPSDSQLGEIAAVGKAQALLYVEILRTPDEAQALIVRKASEGNDGFTHRFELSSADADYPLFVVSAAVSGAGTVDTTSGSVLGQDSGVAELIFETQKADNTQAVNPRDIAELLVDVQVGTSRSNPDGEVGDGSVVLLTTVQADGGLVKGLAIRVIAADSILAPGNAPAAFTVDLSGSEIYRSSTVSRLDPVGEELVITAGGREWSFQGMRQGLSEDRTTSGAALILGVIASAGLGLILQTLQRHALTAGRLERSEFDASHDSLTGLLNRSGVTDVLAAVLESRGDTDVVGILFLDLDRLKVINDSIGHSAGDEVLVIVAERLSAILRGDDVIGRFGGDEFIIVSKEARAVGDLTRLAERVLDALKEPATLSDDSTQVLGASIGIACVGTEEATAEDLLRDADLAMYRAKGAGGGRYELFDAALRAEALARLEVERELRRAIRTGQLVVHYQPIVELGTGRVNRLEALVRWQHPVRGMVPPGAFLSVAAESGLIVDVGEHVLREACRQAALWTVAVGRDVMVSVNVAERQLLDASLVDTVRRVLSETGIKPGQLELELTEELIVERLDNRLTALYELVNMGVKLAIDDFGTSRASLGQLKRLDMVDTLKIDRAFVIDVANDSVDRKIITAIVALAESVGMEIVAEGVEDRDQVEVLRDLGIDLIQGFYFHRPAPAEQVAALLTKTFDVPDAASPAELELT